MAHPHETVRADPAGSDGADVPRRLPVRSGNGSVRGVKGSHPGDASGAANPRSGAWRYAAGQAHQDAEEDLDVHEVPPRRDQLPGHRQRRRGDEAYGGEVVQDNSENAK